jgi:hypothetical protein
MYLPIYKGDLYWTSNIDVLCYKYKQHAMKNDM